jgi:hypothetical protein
VVKIAIIEPNVILDWEKGYIDRIITMANKNPDLNQFRLVSHEDDADLVVLLESCTFKTQRNIKDFESLLYLNNNRRRLCTLNYEDSPPGFLPGLYSSLNAFKFDSSIHISWPHLILPNEKINNVLFNEEAHTSLLFTFSGACSSNIRRKIFDLYSNSSSGYKIQEIKKWYNHNQDEKQSYIDDIRMSKFVLCPKGLASYSHRIHETLALGKVPVIIADEWVPFNVPEKNYFITIPEKDIPNIVQILEEKEPEYERLRKNVITVYNKYFSPDICYSIALNQLGDLYTNRLLNITSHHLSSRWNSKRFWKINKWCIEDRIIRKAREVINSFK